MPQNPKESISNLSVFKPTHLTDEQVSHQVSRLEAQNAKLSSEAERLRKEAERGAKKAANGSRCHDQYQALFKEHQQASDQLQIMKREKERLQKQLLHQESAKSAALKSSPSVHQIQVGSFTEINKMRGCVSFFFTLNRSPT